MASHSSISAARLRRRPDPTPATTHAIDGALRSGIVIEVSENDFQIDIDGKRHSARLAASCLLLPVAEDTVACAQLPDGLWVLAILIRPAGCEQVLKFDDALRIEAPTLKLQSEDFLLHSTRATVMAEDAELLGERLRMVGQTVRLIGSMFDSIFERVTHFASFHSRTTQGLDRVHAEQMDYEAKQLMRLSAEHTLINGDKLVKTRGSQIHFG